MCLWSTIQFISGSRLHHFSPQTATSVAFYPRADGFCVCEFLDSQLWPGSSDQARGMLGQEAYDLDEIIELNISMLSNNHSIWRNDCQLMIRTLRLFHPKKVIYLQLRPLRSWKLWEITKVTGVHSRPQHKSLGLSPVLFLLPCGIHCTHLYEIFTACKYQKNHQLKLTICTFV